MNRDQVALPKNNNFHAEWCLLEPIVENRRWYSWFGGQNLYILCRGEQGRWQTTATGHWSAARCPRAESDKGDHVLRINRRRSHRGSSKGAADRDGVQRIASVQEVRMVFVSYLM